MLRTRPRCETIQPAFPRPAHILICMEGQDFPVVDFSAAYCNLGRICSFEISPSNIASTCLR